MQGVDRETSGVAARGKEGRHWQPEAEHPLFFILGQVPFHSIVIHK